MAGVAADLRLQQGQQVLERHLGRKAQDVRHVQQALVRAVLLGGVHNGQLAQHLAVTLKADDVRVMVRDAHAGRVTAAAAAQIDVELAGRVAARDGNIHPLQVSVQLRKLLFRHGGDDLQVARRVARNEADGNGGGNALAPAGIRYDDAFDVFQNVAADGGVYLLGQSAQQLPKGRGAVGNGDRLRAARSPGTSSSRRMSR